MTRTSRRLSLAAAALLAAFVSCRLLAQDDQPSAEEIRRVVATGAGLSSEQALKNAFTIAVEQAVGTLVDAQSVVRENDAIQEQIITASNGFIKGYDVIKQWQADGLVHCRIEARVQFRQLRQKLEAAHISTIPVSGSNLAARIQTQQAAEQGAAQLIAKRLDDFPNRVLRIKAAGEPVPVASKQDGITRLKVPVLVWVDQEAYSQEIADLTTVLDKSALFKLSARLKFPRAPEQSKDRCGMLRGPHGPLLAREFFQATGLGAPGDGQQTMQTLWKLKRDAQEKLDRLGRKAAVITVWQPVLPTGSTAVAFYAIDPGVLPPANGLDRSRIVVRAALLDGKSDEIDVVEHPFEPLAANGMADGGFVFQTSREFHFPGRNVNEVDQLNLMPGMNFDPNGSGRNVSTAWQGDIFADIESASVARLREIKFSVTWKPETR